MANFDEARFALEAATGGRNTLILDDLGIPSVMVRIPMFRWSEIVDGGEDSPCSAFIIGGKEYGCIYISKYQNVIENGRAYSLPGRDPEHTLTIDEAREACSVKGPGWHLMTNAEWVAIAHWCVRNGTVPRGNSNFGRDYKAKHEHGVIVPGNNGEGPTCEMRTYTGSGPDSWNHDHSAFGISDLNGNIWDFVAGLRVVDGEIQVTRDNDSALNVDEGTDSREWRAINTDGKLVEPGSIGTYKYDGLSPGINCSDDVLAGNGFMLSTSVSYPNYTGTDPDVSYGASSFMRFFEMGAAFGVTPHVRLKQLGLFPSSGTNPNAPYSDNAYRDGAFFFLRNYGERIAARGGSWFDGAGGGIWDLYLREPRDFLFPDVGFRAAYVEI